MSTSDYPDTIEDQDDDVTLDQLPPACAWGMTGWCSGGRHQRCQFNDPTIVAAWHAGTYSPGYAGHRWVCPCICHENVDLPQCPHPDHPAGHRRTLLGGDAAVQAALF